MYLLEPTKPNGVFIREHGFLCNDCIKVRVESCQAAGPNQYFRHSIDLMPNVILNVSIGQGA